MSVIAWHFTGSTLRDGRPVPPVGEWLIHNGPVEICSSGLHASRCALDALQYAPGLMAHLVECEDVTEQHDKLVCRRRRILASVDASETLMAFARWAALSVIHLWDAPDVVQHYLETGDRPLSHAAARAANAAHAAHAATYAAHAARAARAANVAHAATYAAHAARAANAAHAAAHATYAATYAAHAAANAANAANAAHAADDARTIQNERLEAVLLVALGSKHPVLIREAKR